VHGGAHLVGLIERSSCGSALLRSVVSCDVLLDGGRIERPLEPKGPWEHPAALRQREALPIEMQVRTPARHRAARVGNECTPDRNDAQQV
jgi:hypothetical protein